MKKADVVAVLAIAICYGVMMLFGITCPIRFLTGVSCAGCGMTRAWLSAVRLNPGTAFSYHPLFPAVIPAVILFLFQKRIDRRIYRVGMGLIIAAFLICYVFRLIDQTDTIVVFEPEKGIIARILKRILMYL